MRAPTRKWPLFLSIAGLSAGCAAPAAPTAAVAPPAPTAPPAAPRQELRPPASPAAPPKLPRAGRADTPKSFGYLFVNPGQTDTLSSLAAGPDGAVWFAGGSYQGSPDGENPLILGALTAGGAAAWSRALGHAVAEAVALTPDGDLVIAGLYQDGLDLGAPAAPLSEPGATAFVARLSAKDGAPRWAKTAYSWLGSWTEAQHVAIAPGGDVIVGGYFHGGVDWGGGFLTPAGAPGGFVAGLAAKDGAPRFARALGAGLGATVGGVAVDAAGDIYALSYSKVVRGTDEGGGAGETAAALIRRVGAGRLTLHKLSPGGDTLWERALEGTYYSSHAELALDAGGAPVVALDLRGAAKLGKKTYKAEEGLLIARFSPAGEVSWVRQIDATGRDELGALSAAPGGGVIVAGAFRGELALDRAHKSEAAACWIAGLSAAGELEWSQSRPAPGGAFEEITAIAAGADGAVWAAGRRREAGAVKAAAFVLRFAPGEPLPELTAAEAPFRTERMGPDPERESKAPIPCPAGTEARPLPSAIPPEAGAGCFDGATARGPAITWDSDGRLTSRGEFKDGKRHGRWTYWNKEGARYLETDFVDGVEEGLRINTSGGVRRELAFRGGEPAGAAAVYYEHGGKRKEETVDLGGGATRRVVYRRSGELSYELTYRGAALDGPTRELYPGGRLRCEGSYEKGREAGLWTCWHSNGVKAREREYEGGAPKRERQWDRGGAALGEIEYKGGKPARVTGKPIRGDSDSAFGG